MAACILLALPPLSGCGGSKSGAGNIQTEPSERQLWPAGNRLISQRQGCDLLEGTPLPGGHFQIALTDTVSPGRAPIPHNPSERLVFAQLYETLVNVDCDGTLRPGLAEFWACTEDSTVWVFTLREEARLWDGTRITPFEVKEAWTVNQDCPRTRTTVSPWSWFNAKAKSISILDARRLAIQLPEPQADFPLLLAHPSTAIALPKDGWTWPVGSGPCRLQATTPAPLPKLQCRPNQNHPQPPNWDTLTFLVDPVRDSRDFIGLDFDLLLVRDQSALSFYQQAPGYVAVPLPWDRLYLLVVNPELTTGPAELWTEALNAINPEADMTTVSARSWSDIVFPAGATVDCPQLAGPVAMGRSAKRHWNLPEYQLAADALVFDQNDSGAEEIAHRIGALTPEPIRVLGMPSGAASFALDWQMAGANLIRLDQHFATRCLQTATLLGKSAWIQKIALGENQFDRHGNENLIDAQNLTKLAEEGPLQRLRRVIYPVALCRPWFISKGHFSGIWLDFDGTPLLSGLGRDEEAPLP